MHQAKKLIAVDQSNSSSALDRTTHQSIIGSLISLSKLYNRAVKIRAGYISPCTSSTVCLECI